MSLTQISGDVVSANVIAQALTSNTVPGSVIVNNSITAQQIANSSITPTQISTVANTQVIGAMTNIGYGVINSIQIAAGAVGTSQISANAVNLTSQVVGVLPITSGGTGQTSYGTAGQVLTSQGSSAVPTWNTPTVGLITSQTNPFGDNSQILYAPLNGSATDLMGNYTFTTNGTVSYSSQGMRSGYTSPLFSVGNYLATTTNIASSVTGSGARTVSLWAKMASYAGNDPECIVTWGTQSSGQTWAVVTHISSTYQFGVWGYAADLTSGYRPDLNWNHIVVTYDGTQIKMYLNGAPIAYSNQSLNTLQTALWIGQYGSNTSQYFNGYVNSVRVFNRALSGYEASLLYLYGL